METTTSTTTHTALEKLHLLKDALVLTRGNGYTTALRKAAAATPMLIIAGTATDVPKEMKTDWDTLLDSVQRNPALPVFIDNGKLQELLSHVINEINMLRAANGGILVSGLAHAVKHYSQVDDYTPLTETDLVMQKHAHMAIEMAQGSDDLLAQVYPEGYGANSKLGDDSEIDYPDLAPERE